MSAQSNASELLSALPGRVSDLVRRHPRGATAVGSAAGAALALLARPLLRRGSRPLPALPDAAMLAAGAAASVHNAAKGSVVIAIREQDAPTTETVLAAVRLAIVEASAAGADVTAAALGAVGGAIEVAELLDRSSLDLARDAATAARVAAEDVGAAAGVRVSEALAVLEA